MQQKTTWIRYLILGSTISLLLMLGSCKDYFYEKVGEYHFINETSYNISYSLGYDEFNVAPNSTVNIRQSERSGGRKEGAVLSDYISPLASQSAVLTIKFANEKCLIDVKVEDEHSIRNIKNFKAKKLGDNHYEFTYTFTEADYNRAVACP